MHQHDLREVLREVRLHGQLVFSRQIAAGLQHLGCTRRHESRGDDRAHQGIFPVILGDQCLVALDHLLHRLREFGRTVTVHRHLSHHRTHASLLEEPHQQTRTVGMDRCEHTGPHRAEAPQVTDKSAVHPFGVGRIGIFLLLRESVVLQPGQEFQIHRKALVTVLRGMHMHIVHGGNQQTIAKVRHLCPLASQRLQIPGDTYHAPVLHGDIAVLQHLEARPFLGKEDMCLIDFCHLFPLVCSDCKDRKKSRKSKTFGFFLNITAKITILRRRCTRRCRRRCRRGRCQPCRRRGPYACCSRS